MAFKISGFGASQKEEKNITPTYETYMQEKRRHRQRLLSVPS